MILRSGVSVVLISGSDDSVFLGSSSGVSAVSIPSSEDFVVSISPSGGFALSTPGSGVALWILISDICAISLLAVLDQWMKIFVIEIGYLCLKACQRLARDLLRFVQGLLAEDVLQLC